LGYIITTSFTRIQIFYFLLVVDFVPVQNWHRLCLPVNGVLILKTGSMKKILCAIGLSMMITVQVKAQATKFQDLIGNWEIVGEGDEGAGLQVIDSNTIILTYMGETRKLTDYKMDLSKSPCWFDFWAEDSSSVIQVKSILKKEGNDVIKWQLFIDEDRSSHFTASKGELLYLRRTKQIGSGVAAASY
jgi:hypothetical protein